MLSIRRPAPVTIGLGLFAGGVGFGLYWPVAGWLVLGVGLAVVMVRRQGAAVLAIVGLGLGHGLVARRIDAERCAGRIPEGIYRASVRLIEPASPDHPALAIPAMACQGAITLKQRSADTLWAGTVVTVEGRWIPRPSRWRPADGLLVVTGAIETRGADPTRSERLRNWMIRTITRLYGARSGMIEALVLGSRGTIEARLSQSFARSGLVHLLSISGFHVGLVWAWVMMALGASRWRRAAPMVAAIVVVGYVGFIGAPAPALRAALLAILGAVEVRRQRFVAAGALAALVAWLVTIADPWAVTDLGAWLSVSALWGATAAVRWGERVLDGGAIKMVLVSSIGATLATAPFSALVFGSVSLIGVVLNLIAIPLAALALPPVLMSLLLAPIFGPAALAMAGGGGLLLGSLEWIAERGALIPGAAMIFEPGPLPALGAVAAIGLTIGIFGRSNRTVEVRRRLGWAAGVGLIGTLGIGLVDRPHLARGVTLDFLDVGQGDAALIKTSLGHWILIDAGPRDERGDAGNRVIAPFLIRHGVRRLSAVVLSHAHLDHFGGLSSVLGQVAVDVVLEPGVPVPDRRYLALLDQMEDQSVRWRALRSGDSLVVDDVTLAVLHPDASWDGFGEDLNENSVVLALRVGNFEALLSGDAGFPVEERLAGRMGPVELLKVGHHGSRWATGQAWLERIRPEVAVVSVGANRYGHPSPEAIGRLQQSGAEIFRTDRDGTVEVAILAKEFAVTSRRGTVMFPIHP